MTRAEHLEWCKLRALEYCDVGEEMNAWASMASDLRKHPETADHPGIDLGFQLMLTGNMTDLRKFIEGFN